MNAYYIQDRLEAQSWARHCIVKLAREESMQNWQTTWKKACPSTCLNRCTDHLQRHGASKKSITRAFDDDKVSFRCRRQNTSGTWLKPFAHHQVDIDSEV